MDPAPRSLLPLVTAAAALGAALLTTGCAMQQTAPPSTFALPALTGRVHGGNQPVSNSTLQLYAAGTTGYASPAAPLIPTSSYYLGGASGCVTSSSQTCYPGVVSDANGNFTITSDYTCPSATTQVYIVATGGNPGLTAGTNNPALAMMAALGSCGSLTASTHITINELTTVAAVWALAPFMASYANVGTSGTNTAGLAQAFNNAAALVNIADGSVNTGINPSSSNFWTLSLPTYTIKSLGNILAACVNSNGSTLTGTTCASLFAATNPSGSDTIAAALYIAQHPGNNVATLYGLSTANAPFQYALQTQPKDWTLWISYGVNQAGAPNAFSDRAGNFWYGVLYTGTGYIGAASMSPSGTSSCGGDFSQATPVAMDLDGRCWFGARNDTTSGSASNGPYLAVYSGATRISRTLFGTTNAPTATADSNGNIWVTSDNGLYVFSGSTTSPIVSAYTGTGTSGLADGSGNMWSRPNTTTLLSSSVSGSTIATQTFTGPALNPYAMAFDSAGNLWTVNTGNAIAKVTPAAGAYTLSSSYTGGGLNTTSGGSIAIDGDGNVWVANSASKNLSEFSSAGTALSTTSGYGTFVFEGIPPQYPILSPIALAADTSGTLWVISNDTNGSLTGSPDDFYLTGFLGLAAPVSPAVAPGTRP